MVSRKKCSLKMSVGVDHSQESKASLNRFDLVFRSMATKVSQIFIEMKETRPCVGLCSIHA